jgi:Peptidase M1 N-terminal domain
MVDMKTVDDEVITVRSQSSPTFTFTKRQAIVSLAFIIVAVLAVGLLVGFIRPTCPVVMESLTTSGSLSSSHHADDGKPWMNHRLPEHLVPIHYDLSLYPDFYKPNGLPGLFTGNVSIFIKVRDGVLNGSSRHFLVHVKLLEIGRTSVELCLTSNTGGTTKEGGVWCQSTTPLTISKTFQHTVNEYLVIELATPVQPESLVVIRVEFGGLLTNGITGIYRSAYLDSRNGDTK